jgi:hypothetical protein
VEFVFAPAAEALLPAEVVHTWSQCCHKIEASYFVEVSLLVELLRENTDYLIPPNYYSSTVACVDRKDRTPLTLLDVSCRCTISEEVEQAVL